jgi:two-component system, NarL family, sensor kinase
MNSVAHSTLTVHPASRRTEIHHDAAVRCAERQRIGRELHDSTSQLIVALQLNLECLKVSSDNADTHQLFCVFDETLHELHSAVRAVSSSPETLSLERSLPAALKVMATRFALLATMKVTLDVQGQYVSQPSEVEMSLYRIAEEALANVARHAHARAARLQLDCSKSGSLKLTIEDDGVGFDRCLDVRRHEGGTGIANIRQRVRDMGGHLTLKKLHEGSSVAVTIQSPILASAPAA